jgi:hypothetical protein
MHPVVLLQDALVGALRADAVLTSLIGQGVFDAPPKGRKPPYLVLAHHDLIQRDADLVPGHEHRLLLHCWSDQPSRRAALEIAEGVVAVALALGVPGLVVSSVEHVRTDTVIDSRTGWARAAVSLRVMSEVEAGT